jgi:hypothetical protein
MSGILSASPTVQRREERILDRARMDAIDAKVGQLLAESFGGAQAPPAFTDEDVAEVGRLLVEGRVRLPSHVRITVTTEVEEIKSREFGTTSTVFTHTCDQLHAHQLRPMSIQEAIKAGLLVRLNGSWLWSESAYRRLVPPDPRLRT